MVMKELLSSLSEAMSMFYQNTRKLPKKNVMKHEANEIQ
jgi:hypothetical protein